MPDYSMLTELLDLPNTRVTHYQYVGQGRLNLFVESTVVLAMCPTCQALSDSVHETGSGQFIRDLPIWQRRCWLKYAVRRFKCDTCQATFAERVAWREPNAHYTQRYEQYVFERTRREAHLQIAQDEGLSEDQVQGIFERAAKKKLTARGYPRVKVLGLDEITIHKGHGHFRLVITAPELGVVLDVLADREKKTLEAWFQARGADWCAAVEVCTADMWAQYHSVASALLPNARRVVDRFHVMKNLNDAVTKARRSIQKQAEGDAGEKLKGCRWLLVKNSENLTAEEQVNLEQALAASPELRQCYDLKETFRAWYNQAQSRAVAAQTLDDWMEQVKASQLKALEAFTHTVTNWRDSILNYFEGRHSNGFTEGINLKIKLINRRAFGYANFQHFRLHVLTAFTSR